MADLGFDRLSMEPVVCPPDDPCALTEADFPVLCEQYEILAREMLKRAREGRPLIFYHYMIDLKHGPCIYKRVSGCGSGTEYMAVTPWGELFPCHQFVGDGSTASATYRTASCTRRYRRSSAPATPTRARSAATAGRGSTAPAAARRTATTPRAA